MFQFLRRNTSLLFILLPIVILVLWGQNLLHPQFVTHYYDETPMCFYRPFMAIEQWSPLAGTLLSIAILILNIFILFHVNSDIRLIEKRSIFYIYLFIFFTASLQDFRQLNPMQFSLTFIILGLGALFKMYKNEKDLKTIFECGVFFSIATLFYAPVLYFSIIILLGLLILVPFYWRQWLSAIIGYCVPILITIAISFCCGSLYDELSVWNTNLFIEREHAFNLIAPLSYSAYLGLLVVLSMIYIYSGNIRKIATRKYYSIFLILLLLLLAIYFVLPYTTYSILFFGLLPAAILISNYIVNIRSRFWTEFFFIIIIIGTICVQLFPTQSF